MTASPASSSSNATKNSKDTKSSSRRHVQLLRDEPADVDSLGHNSIASAISDLIAGDTPATGIRLLGLWGSGKSTIVRLLSNSGNSNTAVFVFDAWAHRDEAWRTNLEFDQW